MFKRLSDFLADQPMRRKLLYGFGTVVLLTVLVGAAALITDAIREQAEEASNAHSHDAQLALDLNNTMLLARRREKDFISRYGDQGYQAAYDTYAVKQQAAVARFKTYLEELAARPSTAPQAVTELKQVQQQWTVYDTNIQKLFADIKERGSQFETGRALDTLNSLSTFEQDAESLSNPAIMVKASDALEAYWNYSLLSMPGAVVGGAGAAEPQRLTDAENAVTQSLTSLDSAIVLSDLDAADKSRLRRELDQVSTDFKALVELDHRIFAELNTARAAAESVEPTLDNVVQEEVKDSDLALETYHSTQAIARVVEITFILLAVAASILMTILISNVVTRQVDEISKLFRAAAVGEFGSRARVFGKDEMGQTADGVNAILAQLTGLLSEVEAAAKSEVEQIFNTAADGMRLIDTDFNTTRANDTFLHMIGELPEPRGDKPKCYNEFFSSICRTQQCTLKRIMAGEEAVQLEVVKERPDGQKTPCFLIASPFTDAAGNLIGIVEDFRDITEQKKAEEQIRTQNEALTTALDDLRRVAAEVETTAAEVTNASSAMHDIVQLMTGQAASSATVAEKAAASAGQGDRAVHDTVAAIARIRGNTQETAQRIKRLGEVSQEIGEASRLIKDLADRTTVLALNASIQAAAAGEAGRGFAVVAEEVQRLAERATGATRQIDEMIAGIRAEANEAMVSIEQVTREVVEGSSLAQSAGEQLTTLNQLSSELSTLIQHIAETTAAQTSDSLNRLADLTEGLRTSVAGFRTPEVTYQGGNGGHASG